MKNTNSKTNYWANVFHRIDFIMKNDSFRQMLSRVLGIDEIPADAVGWCAAFMKQEIPDIEIYIDKLAVESALELKRLGKLDEETLIYTLKYGLSMSVLHEIMHLVGKVRNEQAVEWITAIMMADAWMGWKFIPCPNKNDNLVTWVECLQCDDNTKHDTCPFRNVRIDSAPREYELGKYHVTELSHPLKSYFERINPYTRRWDETWDFLYGKALGAYIENKYAEHTRECSLKHPFKCDDDNIEIVGSSDLILDKTGRLVEIKFYYDLKYMIQNNSPSEDHIFQVQCYYGMGIEYKPWLFKALNRITILYYGKMKRRTSPRRKEFDVPLQSNLPVAENQARVLHRALKAKTPPLDYRCPKWLCKYCKHFICPFHPKHGS